MKNNLILILAIFITSGFCNETGPIILNEIFFKTGKSGEWIELYNRSNTTVNLNGWQLADLKGVAPISYKDVFIKPGGVILLVKELPESENFGIKYICPSKWLSLNDDKDNISLLLPYSNVVSDSVYYEGAWLKDESQCLRRIKGNYHAVNKSDWMSSTPTPGYLSAGESCCEEITYSLSCAPLVFTPDDDGENDLFMIYPKGEISKNIKIKIIGFSGEIYQEKDIEMMHKYYWNGRCANGTIAKSGPFFVIAEFPDNSVIKNRGVLWVK